ncbi:RNA methyltransferase, partial [Thalassiosira pseudonana CCMP1335]
MHNLSYHLCTTRQRSISAECITSFCSIRGKHSQSQGRNIKQSSRTWLERQQKDPYVHQAKKEGLPSRASFKLKEINEETNTPQPKRLIAPNMLVLDLGAAPGGWSLYASTQLVASQGGAVVAVDLLPLSTEGDVIGRIENNLHGQFTFIQGDFTEKHVRDDIMDSFAQLSGNQTLPGLIVSDMAPHFTGDTKTDALQTINLCEQALTFAVGDDCFDNSYSPRDAKGTLASGGSFLCKYFSCGKENELDLMEAIKRAFRSVHVLKPKASRKESSEMYLLGLDF